MENEEQMFSNGYFSKRIAQMLGKKIEQDNEEDEIEEE